MIIRLGAAEDFSAYVGGAKFPAEWCCGSPVGLVAEDDGHIVAVAMVTRDQAGRLWLWYNARVALSAVTLHRLATRLLEQLKRAGASEIYAFCDERVETAARWLERLGFEPKCRVRHPAPPCEEKVAWACPLN